MLLRSETLHGIERGTISLAFRRWKRPTVRSGGTLLTGAGQLEIGAVVIVSAADITEPDAVRAGFPSKDALLAELNRRAEGDVYRIELLSLKPDPRIALRGSPARDRGGSLGRVRRPMMPRAQRLPRCLAAGLLAVLLTAPPARAQTSPAIDGVDVMVSMSADGREAVVVARYRLRVPEGADTLRLEAIPFFGLRPMDVTATLNGSALRVHGGFETAGNGIRIVLGAGAAELELRYTVPGAALTGDRDIDLRVPLVLPVAVATESGDDFFRVELSAPPGFTVAESFPSVAPIASAHPHVDHAMRLPAAPSLLRWRLTTGVARLGFAHTVDIALAAVLAVLGLLGVRALRRPVMREE